MNVFLSISVALFAGLMFTRIFKLLGANFPDVTAFLIAGLLIGPYGLGRAGIEGLGFVSYEAVQDVGVVNTAALGFIAFSIGSEFRLSALKLAPQFHPHRLRNRLRPHFLYAVLTEFFSSPASRI